LDDLAAMHGLTREDVLAQVYLASIPQKRVLDPQEIAAMARYLASDEARGITGQAINVSAGFIMH
jgi:3-hydroxybutyrate dehydrogenase